MRVILLVALLALVVFLLLARPTPQDLRRYLVRGGLIAAAALLILLAVTGRLHWLFALLGSALPFAGRLLALLRFLPLVNALRGRYRRARSAGGPSPGSRSSVNTAYLRMTLDHDSGAMDGEVLQGRFAGITLSTLSLAQLRELHAEYLGLDPDSAELLDAFAQRMHGEAWTAADAGPRERSAADSDHHMTPTEALQILGLDEGAGDAEVVAAHRRLMQKLHPDRGGSTYLAARINQAKDVLLGAGRRVG